MREQQRDYPKQNYAACVREGHCAAKHHRVPHAPASTSEVGRNHRLPMTRCQRVECAECHGDEHSGNRIPRPARWCAQEVREPRHAPHVR